MRAIILTVVLIYLTACGGGGGDDSSSVPAQQQAQPTDSTSSSASDNTSTGSDSSNDNDETSSEDDTSLSDLIIPANFDWATSETKEVSVNVVSSITQIETESSDNQTTIEGAPIGGKHFIKVEALDENENVVSTPLKSLTSQVGSVRTVMKLSPSVTQVRISAKANGQNCTKNIPVSELTTSLNIECDIPVASDLEDSQ
ncbi:hypothetical protein ABMY35_18955 [Pseudoalteromonas sp. BZB3]|uniref:hypothetical protein n=1 Tax=Pseudoalteromonas sp. BZB3 TaxID=3136670 RepID=UPI0032C43350